MDKITQAIKVLTALDSALMNFQYLLGTKAVPSPDDPHKYFWSNDAKAKPLITQDLALLTVQGFHSQIRDLFKLLLEFQATDSTELPTIGHLEAERVILDLKDKLEDYLDRCTEISQQQAPSKTPQEMMPQE